MRTSRLGRWVGRTAAVVAIGTGTIGGFATADAVDEPGADSARAVYEASSTSSGGDATDSNEWG